MPNHFSSPPFTTAGRAPRAQLARPHLPRPLRPNPQLPSRLRPSVVLAGVAMVAGVVSGLVAVAHRSPVREAQVAGTSAWAVHLALSAVAIVWAVLVILAHRRGRRSWWHPRNPLGENLLRRAGDLFRRPRSHRLALLRIVTVTVLYVFELFLVYRSAMQPVIGLDPNQTVNAWGGPGYWGALYCHWLDAGLMAATAAVAIGMLAGRDGSVLGTRPSSDRSYRYR